jgi:SAM-dependent methyltransferase
MRFLYKLMYTIGFTPWDTQDTQVPTVLQDIIEGTQAISTGKALDLGCGMGRHSIYLASHGWQVTGLDSSGRALRTARQRAEKVGLNVTFIRGDVTRLEKTGLTGPFNFFLDGGCFHGMSDDERSRYNNSITQVAASDSELLIFSFGPNKRGIPPRGAEIGDVDRCFSANWKIISSVIDRDMPDTLKDSYTYAAWYRLKKH